MNAWTFFFVFIGVFYLTVQVFRLFDAMDRLEQKPFPHTRHGRKAGFPDCSTSIEQMADQTT